MNHIIDPTESEPAGPILKPGENIPSHLVPAVIVRDGMEIMAAKFAPASPKFSTL